MFNDIRFLFFEQGSLTFYWVSKIIWCLPESSYVTHIILSTWNNIIQLYDHFYFFPSLTEMKNANISVSFHLILEDETKKEKNLYWKCYLCALKLISLI